MRPAPWPVYPARSDASAPRTLRPMDGPRGAGKDPGRVRRHRPVGARDRRALVNGSSGRREVVHADNLSVLARLPDASFDLVYIDPPFNTGKRQRRTHMKTVQSATGDRTGFGGKRYATT